MPEDWPARLEPVAVSVMALWCTEAVVQFLTVRACAVEARAHMGCRLRRSSQPTALWLPTKQPHTTGAAAARSLPRPPTPAGWAAGVAVPLARRLE